MHKAAKTRKVHSRRAVNKGKRGAVSSWAQPPVPVPETSSDPAPIPVEQRKLFQQVLTLLGQNRIPCAVAGAFALQAHTGICRDTKDLDLFLTAGNAAIALALLRREGFDCEVCDPVWLYKAHRNGFFVDLITGMSNAAIAVQDSWIERAKPVVIHAVQTRVLAAEELLVSKLFVTRRERFDGADIAHIVYGTHGKLDWQRILALAGEHWEILFWSLVFFHYAYPAQSEYVPREVWQGLIDRFQNAVFRPNPRQKFRGSLIDDKMFAIDVREWGLENLYLDLRNRRLQEIRLPPSVPR